MIVKCLCQSLLAASVLLSCEPVIAQVDDTEPAKDTLQEFLDAMPDIGYLVVDELSAVPVDEWERTTFATISSREAAVKGTVPVDWGEALYFRFTFIEQTYRNDENARARWLRLREKPENLQGYREKVFPLRRGFAIGDKVYIVTTDVARFSDALDAMTETLGAFLLADQDERKDVIIGVRRETEIDLTRKLVQQRLADLGYYSSAVDGIIGSGSRAAIANYRAETGLADSESIDQELIGSLGIPPDPVASFVDMRRLPQQP